MDRRLFLYARLLCYAVSRVRDIPEEWLNKFGLTRLDKKEEKDSENKDKEDKDKDAP